MPSSSASIELRIPARHDPVAGSRDIRPKKVEEWISGLPLANLGETARQVYNALLEFNSLNINVSDRMSIMEQFRPTAQYITNSLKKHFVGQMFPLSAKNRKIAELAREIFSQMAAGYKIIIVDTQAAPAKIDPRFMATSIHRAMRYLSGVLLGTYQIYDPYPPGVWGEIHQLLQLAESNNLHEIRIADTDFTLVKESTISDVYKQSMLLALACPYRLRRGEVEQVNSALERWASHTKLMSGQQASSSQGIFVVNLSKDAAPSYLILQNEKDLSNCRILDPQGLTTVIREEMIQTRERGNGQHAANGNVSLDIMRRLMLAWGVVPKRRFNRIKKSATVLVAMGLSTAHHFISHEADATPHGEQRPDFTRPAEFTSVPSTNEHHEMPPLWELKGHSIEWSKREAGEQARRTPASHYNCQTWHMTNVSAGGYCLLWDNAETTQAQVGELLCIQEQGLGDADHWGIGVIRWMKSSPDQGLELGIQMLAPSAAPVATRIANENAMSGEFQRSLLLAQIKAIDQPASVLVPSLNHQVGQVLTVNAHGNESQIQLTKLLENTGTFAQFQFTPLNTSGVETRHDKPGETADFDSLWSSL